MTLIFLLPLSCSCDTAARKPESTTKIPWGLFRKQLRQIEPEKVYPCRAKSAPLLRTVNRNFTVSNSAVIRLVHSFSFSLFVCLSFLVWCLCFQSSQLSSVFFFFFTFPNGLFSSSYCQILLFFSTFTFFWQTLWDNFRQVEINKTHTFLRCSLAAIWFSGFPVKLFPLLLLLLVSLLSWSFFANLVHPFSTSFYSDIFQSCAKSCQNRCDSGQNLVCFFSISSCVLLLLLPMAIFCFFCLYIVVLLPHPLAITLVLCRNFCFMISFQHTTHQYFPRLCRSWKIYFRFSSDSRTTSNIYYRPLTGILAH